MLQRGGSLISVLSRRPSAVHFGKRPPYALHFGTAALPKITFVKKIYQDGSTCQKCAFVDGKRRFVFKALGAATLMELSTHEDQLFFTGSDKWLAGTLVAPSHHGGEGYLLMAAVCRTETDGAEDAPGQMQIGVWKVPLSMLRQRQPADSAGGAGGK